MMFMINDKKLENEIIHVMRLLGKKDRNLKTITIMCNPNRIHGSDKNLSEKIKKILDILIIQKKIKKRIENNRSKEFYDFLM